MIFELAHLQSKPREEMKQTCLENYTQRFPRIYWQDSFCASLCLSLVHLLFFFSKSCRHFPLSEGICTPSPICIPAATRLPSRLQSRPGRCSRQHFALRDGTNAHAHFRLGVSFKGKGGGRAQRELHSPSHLLMMALGLRDCLYQYRLEVKVCLFKFCFSFHPIDGWRRQIHPPGRTTVLQCVPANVPS